MSEERAYLQKAIRVFCTLVLSSLFADTLSDVIFYIFQSDGAMNTLTQEEKESIWYG